jgi:hypothetical protein
MSDQDVAMRIAVASAFRDCGLPSDEHVSLLDIHLQFED